MNMLLTEVMDHVNIVPPGAPGKSYYIQGVFLQGNLQNRNGRVYPMAILEKEVDRYNREYISKKRALGELGHPDGPGINLDRVSHLITELYRDGNNFVGKAKILDTPHGKIVKSLIDAQVMLGVSSRGMGTLREAGNGVHEVQDDFYLATAADIVADPSAPDAFVQGIMEGKEWVWNNGILTERVIDGYKKKIDTPKFNETRALDLFSQFMQDISGV